MLYTPMLPEAASGTLEPRHVVVPLRMMCPHAELLLGRATALDTERRRVDGRDRGRHARRRTTSELVVALGAVPRTLPIPGLAEHALGFKTLADAIHLRNHVLRRLEAAAAAADRGRPRARADLRLRRRRLRGRRGARRARRPRPRRAALLPDAPRRAAALGARRRGAEDPAGDPDRGSATTRREQLARRGVDIRVSTTLESLEPHAAVLSDGDADRDGARSSGRRACKPNPLLGQFGLPLDERGRVRVDALPARRGPRATCGRSATAPASRTSRRPAGPTRRPASICSWSKYYC